MPLIESEIFFPNAGLEIGWLLRYDNADWNRKDNHRCSFQRFRIEREGVARRTEANLRLGRSPAARYTAAARPGRTAERPPPARSAATRATEMLRRQELLKIRGRCTEHVQPALNRPVQSAIEANMSVSVFVTLGNSCHSPLFSSKA